MNKQIPAWTLYLTIGVSLFLLCGVGAIASTGQPEPETRTVTKTVTKKIEDTEKIDELTSDLKICKQSTRLSSQAFIDALNAFVKVSQAVSNLDASQVEEATRIIQSIDAERVGTEAKNCDPEIASQLTGLEGY